MADDSTSVPPPSPAPSPAPASASASSTGLQVTVAAGLSYVFGWITGLIFFLVEKSSKVVKFHAAQSLVTFGGLVAVYMVLGIGCMIPFLGLLFLPLIALVGLASFVLWIICMVFAFQGRPLKLPLVGDLAEKLAEGKPLTAPSAASAPAPAGSDPAAPSSAPAAVPATAPVPSSGSNVLLILGIIFGVLVLLIGGGILMVILAFKSCVKIDDERADIQIPGVGKISMDKSEWEEMANPTPIKAETDKVKEFFPTGLAGWKRESEPEVFRMEDGLSARADFVQGDAKVGVTIASGPLTLQAAPWMMGLMEIETKEFKTRRITQGGFKGMEYRGHQEKCARVWLRTGKVVVIAEHEGTDDPAEAYRVLEAMDLKGLSKLE